MEHWGPTIVTLVAMLLMGVVGYLYTAGQQSKDDRLTELIEANGKVASEQVKSQFEMVKGLHELSTAVSLLKQAFEHISVDGEKKNVAFMAHLNAQQEDLDRMWSQVNKLASDMNLVRLRLDLNGSYQQQHHNKGD